jgi:N6-adenosine-specific RNA methylase IME4
LAPAFTDDTAKKTGKSPATVKREVARGNNVIVLAQIIGTKLDQKGELEALGKLSATDQHDLAEQAKLDGKVSAKIVVKRRRREQREKELAARTKAAALTLGRELFGVIYADPPIDFRVWSRVTGMDRHVTNHYPVMPIQDICALQVPAAPNAVLFLWAAPATRPLSEKIMAAWGFDYVTDTVWEKTDREGDDRIGLGYWFRNMHEYLLVGTRGNVPAPAPGTQWPSVIRAPVGRHSQKPEIFARMIEEYFPTASRIELFARLPRAGWTVWGNEVVEADSGDRSAKAMPTEAAP